MPTTGSRPAAPPRITPCRNRMRVSKMRFRPLALFALTAALAVLVGEFGTGDAFAQEKKGKKKKQVDPPLPAPTKVADPEPVRPPAKPLPTVVPAPKARDAV